MENIIPDPKTLGRVVRQARKLQELTQDDLAGMSGTGRRFISDLEKGKETIQIGKVLLILRTLGLTLQVLGKWE